MKTVAFFNNKGGVGKTSLAYHLAWMYSGLQVKVLAVDLDPQANLTSMFLKEDRLEEIWPDEGDQKSIYGAIAPVIEGIGDIAGPHIENISRNLYLIPGDLRLSSSENELNRQWPDCNDGEPRAFRVISAFYRAMMKAGEECGAEIILIDVGPNLGSINRSALISAENLVIPLAPDIYSLQGLRNLGPTLKGWREDWSQRCVRNPIKGLSIPNAIINPVGYVVLQHAIRLDRPVKSYLKWLNRIPSAYRTHILGEKNDEKITVENDPYCLAMLKHYRSLMPMAMEVHKPMFSLKPADGAIGSHGKAAAGCYEDFRALACDIAYMIDLEML